MNVVAATSQARQRRMLNFYGYRIAVEYDAELTLPGFEKEFQFFDCVDDEADLTIVLQRSAVDCNAFGFIRPSFYSPRNICYHHNGEKIINYHGKALLVEEGSGELVTIVSSDELLLESITYTVIIAKSGMHLDRCGTYRVHALGFSYNGRAALVLLPMGGGKSTLLLELLRHPGVKLISEDTPLLSSDGKLHPFPIKIGILPGNIPDDVPKDLIQRVRHLEGVEKDVIDLSYLSGRIEKTPVPAQAVFLGERYLGRSCEIVPVSFVSAYRTFFRDCVVGLGVYQGLEFVLTKSSKELFAKAALGMRRAYACGRFLKGVERYEFRMGTVPRENAAQLLAAISRLNPGE